MDYCHCKSCSYHQPNKGLFHGLGFYFQKTDNKINQKIYEINRHHIWKNGGKVYLSPSEIDVNIILIHLPKEYKKNYIFNLNENSNPILEKFQNRNSSSSLVSRLYLSIKPDDEINRIKQYFEIVENQEEGEISDKIILRLDWINDCLDSKRVLDCKYSWSGWKIRGTYNSTLASQGSSSEGILDGRSLGDKNLSNRNSTKTSDQGRNKDQTRNRNQVYIEKVVRDKNQDGTQNSQSLQNGTQNNNGSDFNPLKIQMQQNQNQGQIQNLDQLPCNNSNIVVAIPIPNPKTHSNTNPISNHVDIRQKSIISQEEPIQYNIQDLPASPVDDQNQNQDKITFRVTPTDQDSIIGQAKTQNRSETSSSNPVIIPEPTPNSSVTPKSQSVQNPHNINKPKRKDQPQPNQQESIKPINKKKKITSNKVNQSPTQPSSTIPLSIMKTANSSKTTRKIRFKRNVELIRPAFPLFPKPSTLSSPQIDDDIDQLHMGIETRKLQSVKAQMDQPRITLRFKSPNIPTAYSKAKDDKSKSSSSTSVAVEEVPMGAKSRTTVAKSSTTTLPLRALLPITATINSSGPSRTSYTANTSATTGSQGSSLTADRVLEQDSTATSHIIASDKTLPSASSFTRSLSVAFQSPREIPQPSDPKSPVPVTPYSSTPSIPFDISDDSTYDNFDPSAKQFNPTLTKQVVDIQINNNRQLSSDRLQDVVKKSDLVVVKQEKDSTPPIKRSIFSICGQLIDIGRKEEPRLPPIREDTQTRKFAEMSPHQSIQQSTEDQGSIEEDIDTQQITETLPDQVARQPNEDQGSLHEDTQNHGIIETQSDQAVQQSNLDQGDESDTESMVDLDLMDVWAAMIDLSYSEERDGLSPARSGGHLPIEDNANMVSCPMEQEGLAVIDDKIDLPVEAQVADMITDPEQQEDLDIELQDIDQAANMILTGEGESMEVDSIRDCPPTLPCQDDGDKGIDLPSVEQVTNEVLTDEEENIEIDSIRDVSLNLPSQAKSATENSPSTTTVTLSSNQLFVDVSGQPLRLYVWGLEKWYTGKIREYGGTATKNSFQCDVILFSRKSNQRFELSPRSNEEHLLFAQAFEKGQKVLSCLWILDSIQENKLLPEDNYSIWLSDNNLFSQRKAAVEGNEKRHDNQRLAIEQGRIIAKSRYCTKIEKPKFKKQNPYSRLYENFSLKEADLAFLITCIESAADDRKLNSHTSLREFIDAMDDDTPHRKWYPFFKEHRNEVFAELKILNREHIVPVIKSFFNQKSSSKIKKVNIQEPPDWLVNPSFRDTEESYRAMDLGSEIDSDEDNY